MTITDPSSSEDIPLILIVDDDRSTRTLLKVAMEEEGYRVITAKDGEECLSEYHRCQPDMILLDAVMPEMDGFSCCKRLTELSEKHPIPILMITALDDQDSIDQAFACGAVDYITKPIHWAVLAQRVKRLLTTSKALAQLEQLQQQLYSSQEWMKFLETTSKSLSEPFVLKAFLKDIIDRVCLIAQVQQVSLYQNSGPICLESGTGGYHFPKNCSTEILGLEPFYRTHYQQGEAIAIEDIHTISHIPQTAIPTLLNTHVRSLLILPIVIQGTIWGVLCVTYYQTPHRWEFWEIEQFKCLANLLALAIKSKH